MDVLQAIDTSAPSRETDIDAILAEVDAQVRKNGSPTKKLLTLRFAC
jgi:hypothetical protein